MGLGGVAQAVENNAWLNAGQPRRGIDRVERIHVARIVEDHGHIDALAGEAGARAARQNGSAGGAAGGQSGLNIGRVAGKNDADGKLAVVRGIGSVKGARAKIEADFAAKRFLQQGLKLTVSRKLLMGEWRGIGKDGKRGRAHAAMVARLGRRWLARAYCIEQWPGRGSASEIGRVTSPATLRQRRQGR